MKVTQKDDFHCLMPDWLRVLRDSKKLMAYLMVRLIMKEPHWLMACCSPKDVSMRMAHLWVRLIKKDLH